MSRCRSAQFPSRRFRLSRRLPPELLRRALNAPCRGRAVWRSRRSAVSNRLRFSDKLSCGRSRVCTSVQSGAVHFGNTDTGVPLLPFFAINKASMTLKVLSGFRQQRQRLLSPRTPPGRSARHSRSPPEPPAARRGAAGALSAAIYGRFHLSRYRYSRRRCRTAFRESIFHIPRPRALPRWHGSRRNLHGSRESRRRHGENGFLSSFPH